MTITMGSRGELRSAPRPRETDKQSSFLSRWLRVWVLVLTVVTMVVVVFLVVITNTLASINGNLRTATRGVTGTGANTRSLPSQVDQINGGLAAIDPALKPIPGQANEIIAALTSINDRLTATDLSLKETSPVLVSVLGSVTGISDVLIDADSPPDRLGVQNIHQRVTAVNGAGGGDCGQFCTASNLTTVEQDARNILSGLVAVNRHLNSVCNSTVAGLLKGREC